jgi:hypothetical protein
MGNHLFATELFPETDPFVMDQESHPFATVQKENHPFEMDRHLENRLSRAIGMGLSTRESRPLEAFLETKAENHPLAIENPSPLVEEKPRT